MLNIIWRGMAVGITETVPGISGSTIAMVLGVYEQLIQSLSLLSSRRWRETIPFLLKFGGGMVFGFALSISLIVFLLENYRTPTLIFFVGIIVGFLPYLYKETLRQCNASLQVKHYLIMVGFFVLVTSGQLLRGLNPIDLNALTAGDYAFLVVAGGLASTALVLPGISGALILTILGIYEVATTALKTMQLPVVAAIGIGIMTGVLLTSRLVRYLLSHRTVETYCAMLGLVAGSIFAILGNVERSLQLPVIVASFLTFVCGISLIVVLHKVQGNTKSVNPVSNSDSTIIAG